MSFQHIEDLQNEEDIRTKLVSTWLSGHGISSCNIHLEHRFTIRLGRAILQVENGTISNSKPSNTANQTVRGGQVFNPRADILVRNSEGQNLLIIEVKGPNEVLDDDARDQGISYARLLNGNIAPFVVLTNGRETRIFDSITRRLIDGETIPCDHRYVRAGFKVGGDDLMLRAEALENLISLSADNLLAFSAAQTQLRMARLKSEGLNSGKKYVPSLYVDRVDASHRLKHFLDDQRRRVVVVVGPPQVGKTNFICHTVDQRLREGRPCLFYPAIGLRQSLLSELSADFDWILGDATSSAQIIFKKLQSVLRRSRATLTLFIDGWNETNLKLAREIDYDCERLCCDEIQIVISLTNVAAGRLLSGSRGNPSFIAEQASITQEAIKRIEVDPHIQRQSDEWSVVDLGRYSETERNVAYEKYAKGYDVTIPSNHIPVSEPYTLGNAMKLYQHSELPAELDEPDLVKQVIEGKALRAGDLEDINVRLALSALANEMLVNGSPVPLDRALNVWNLRLSDKIPPGFFESAILAEVTDEHDSPSIDFYYAVERDFVISHWVRNWNEKSKKRINLEKEFVDAVQSNPGAEALRWFLKQPQHIKYLESENGMLPIYVNANVRKIFMASLCDLVAKGHDGNETWMEYAVQCATNDPDKLVRIDAVRLTALLSGKHGNSLTRVLKEDDDLLEEFLIGILSINDEYPFQADTVGELVLEALHELTREDGCGVFDEGEPGEYSKISEVLVKLMNHKSATVREGAASCLGYITPVNFLSILAQDAKSALSVAPDKIRERAAGLGHATAELHEIYYGTYCKGWLSRLREERALVGSAYRPSTEDDDWIGFHQELKRFRPIFEPVIFLYESEKCVEILKNILEDLLPYSGLSQDEDGSKPSLDRLTIPLPFSD